jgi:hypothetical protein
VTALPKSSLRPRKSLNKRTSLSQLSDADAAALHTFPAVCSILQQRLTLSPTLVGPVEQTPNEQEIHIRPLAARPIRLPHGALRQLSPTAIQVHGTAFTHQPATASALALTNWKRVAYAILR